MNLTMTNLENCFAAAKEVGAKFVGIAIQLRGTDKKEIIINPVENFDLKLGYYKQAYDENLNMKNVEGISILGFTYGDDFLDIELDLLGETHKGITVEEMKEIGTEFDFGTAIAMLKEDEKVARKGWNGKGMWLKLIEADDYSTCGTGVKNKLPWVAMKTADDKIVPWLASQTDVLAEDWVLV